MGVGANVKHVLNFQPIVIRGLFSRFAKLLRFDDRVGRYSRVLYDWAAAQPAWNDLDSRTILPEIRFHTRIVALSESGVSLYSPS